MTPKPHLLGAMLAFLLVFLSCSGEKPAQPFTLIVDNETQFTYNIYVDGSFGGVAEAGSTVTIGEFDQDGETSLRAIYESYTDFQENVNTVGRQTYTWTLEITEFRLYVENNTNEDLAILCDYQYLGVVGATSTMDFGMRPQKTYSYLQAYGPDPPGHYWDYPVRTIGKKQLTWEINITD